MTASGLARSVRIGVSVLLCAVLCSTAAAELKGDVDQDGDVDFADLEALRAQLTLGDPDALPALALSSANVAPNVTPGHGVPLPGRPILDLGDFVVLARALGGAELLPSLPTPTIAISASDDPLQVENPTPIDVSIPTAAPAGTRVVLYVNGEPQVGGALDLASQTAVTMNAFLDDLGSDGQQVIANEIVARLESIDPQDPRIRLYSAPSNTLSGDDLRFDQTLGDPVAFPTSGSPGNPAYLVLGRDDGSPATYRLATNGAGDSVLPADMELVVLPGASLEFDAGQELFAGNTDSRLLLEGTGDEPISLAASDTSWDGIKVQGGHHVLRHVVITGASQAIFAQYQATLLIEDCQIVGFSTGIRVRAFSAATIARCDLDGKPPPVNSRGIVAEPLGNTVDSEVDELYLYDNDITASRAVSVKYVDAQGGSASHRIWRNQLTGFGWGIGYGIRIEHTSPDLQWNDIQNFPVAIVLDDEDAGGIPSDPLISFNTIADNDLGLRIESSPPGPDPVVVRATRNWWGSAETSSILAQIENPAAVRVVDFSSFAVDDTLLAGSAPGFEPAFREVAKLGGDVVRPLGGTGPASVSMEFQALAGGAVGMSVHEDQEGQPGPALRSMAADECNPPGPGDAPCDEIASCEVCTASWDGRDDLGRLVPDGAYLFTLSATSPGSDLSWSPAPPTASPSEINFTGNPWPSDYNAYRNEPLEWGFNVDEPGYFRMWITDVGNDIEYNPDRFVTEIIPRVALPPGSLEQFTWGGREIDVSSGTPVHTATFVGTDAFPWLEDELWLKVARTPLASNTLIVQDTVVEITGRAPELAVKASPYLISHSYDQEVTVEFCVDQDARVTVRLLEAGEANAIDAGGGDATLDYFIHAGSGAPFADLEVGATGDCAGQPEVARWSGTAAPGVYLFLIEATSEYYLDPAEGYSQDAATRAQYTATRRGVVQVQ